MASAWSSISSKVIADPPPRWRVRQRLTSLHRRALLLPEATEAHGSVQPSDFASWRRGMSRARCNQASADCVCIAEIAETHAGKTSMDTGPGSDITLGLG